MEDLGPMARDRRRLGDKSVAQIASQDVAERPEDRSDPKCVGRHADTSLVRRPRPPVSHHGEVDLDRLESALAIVAALVIENPRYAPVFDRLMAEREQLIERQDTVSRAQALLAERTASGEVVGDG